MDYMEFTAKSVQEAITEACTHYMVASDRLDYEVVEEGSSGFLGIGSKSAIIKARVKEESEAAEAEAVLNEVKEKLQNRYKIIEFMSLSDVYSD